MISEVLYMFLIKLVNLYGMEGKNAYYKERGDCFDFTWDKNHATRFSDQDKMLRILDHSEYYCSIYGAKELCIVPLEG